MSGTAQKTTEKKLLEHLLFCILLLVLLFSGRWVLNKQGFAPEQASVITCRFLFFIFCIYTGRWLCQRFYLKNRLALFVVGILVTCIIASVVWWLIIKFGLGHSYADFIEMILSAMPFFIIGLGLGMLVKLIRFTVNKRVQDAQIKTEQKQMELNLLQSQLSPHFLFNTLNNMYSISIVQHELLPSLLLKLSDLLRYSVYDARQSFLPLQEELAYIMNYIDFEKIRIGDRLCLELDIAPPIDVTVQVPPMVLIVFIENAFKHARNTLDQQIHISIELRTTQEYILLSVRNSYGNVDGEKDRLSEASGLGLANTIKRLHLMYQDRFKLQRVMEEGYYNIHLQLPINHIL